MFSYPEPMSKDHKIIEHEYCSGYTDNFGKWNTGFYCPQTDSMTAVYCCETPTFKYCCTIRQGNHNHMDESEPSFIRTPIVAGIITGITLVLLFITVASCFFCSCCFVYKKRQAHLTGGLYRMQGSSSTTSGLVNMYSPSSTSNLNSLVTTPLDMECSQQGQFSQNHNSNLNPHGHIMTLSSVANGHGYGYPESLLSSGFPHSNNYNHITLPRYQSLPPPQQSNLPPPVFYPHNHFRTSGEPYSLAISNINASNFPASTRQQQPHTQINYPIMSLQTASRTQNQRIPGSILRVTNANYGNGPSTMSNSSATQTNPFSDFGLSGTYGRTSGIITAGRPQGLQINTIPRRSISVISGASSSSPIFPSALRQPFDQRNLGVGRESMNVHEVPRSSLLATSQPQGSNRYRSNNGPATIGHSNLHRLTCLSSSDSQHQALNASAL